MVFSGVNVLAYAHREDAANHGAYRAWLEGVVNGDEAYGISELVLRRFVRVVTHPKVFKRPSHVADAVAFADQLRDQPNCVRVQPRLRHCRSSSAGLGGFTHRKHQASPSEYETSLRPLLPQTFRLPTVDETILQTGMGPYMGDAFSRFHYFSADVGEA